MIPTPEQQYKLPEDVEKRLREKFVGLPPSGNYYPGLKNRFLYGDPDELEQFLSHELALAEKRGEERAMRCSLNYLGRLKGPPGEVIEKMYNFLGESLIEGGK